MPLHLLIDFRYQESVRALQASPSACPELRVWDVPASYEEALIGCLAEIGVTTVGFEAAHVTVARYEWWRETIAGRGARHHAAIDRAHRRTGADDQGRVRGGDPSRRGRSTRAGDAGCAGGGPCREDRAADRRRPSKPAMREAGYERLAFDTIVASGPHSAMPHYRAGTRVLAAGDLLVLDFGGVLDGYCCDLTRTVSIGPPSREARRVYDAVRDAHAAAVAAVKTGHRRVGGGCGGARRPARPRARRRLRAWHRPRSRPRRTRRAAHRQAAHGCAAGRSLRPDMVFTIEPGAYLPGIRRRANRRRRARDRQRLRTAHPRSQREAARAVIDEFRRHQTDPRHDARARLAEFELERDNVKLRLRKNAAGHWTRRARGAAGPVRAADACSGSCRDRRCRAAVLAPADEALDLAVVKSPIVGTFYRRSRARREAVSRRSATRCGRVRCCASSRR